MTFTEGLFETLNNFGDGISQLFTQLAGIVGETVAHLYMVLVRQQIVYGIQNLIMFLSYMSFPLVATFLYKKFKKTTFHDEDKLAIYVLLFLLAFYGIAQSLPFFNQAIGYFVNPEYYAILEAKNILQTIK